MYGHFPHDGLTRGRIRDRIIKKSMKRRLHIDKNCNPTESVFLQIYPDAWIQFSARIDLPGQSVLPGYSFHGLPGKAVKMFDKIDVSAWMPTQTCPDIARILSTTQITVVWWWEPPAWKNKCCCFTFSHLRIVLYSGSENEVKPNGFLTFSNENAVKPTVLQRCLGKTCKTNGFLMLLNENSIKPMFCLTLLSENAIKKIVLCLTLLNENAIKPMVFQRF